MSRTILFVCPHNAAKSVLAVAYFERLAQQHRLDISGNSGGTEPDPAVAPAVTALLQGEGVDVSGYKPRSLTQADIDAAFHVVSFNSPLDQFDLSNVTVEYWNDVPAASVNLPASRDAIAAHVERLITEFRQKEQI